MIGGNLHFPRSGPVLRHPEGGPFFVMEENIDFEQNTITIRHTVTSCDLDGKRVLVASDTTKTKSSILLLIKQKQINGGETGEYRINHFSARCL